MAGFHNDVMHADNVDFRGVTSVKPQVLNDGELLIGSAVAPNIRVNTLTAGAGISIINGNGTILITNTGGGGPVTGTTTLSGNSGAATEVGGIINVLGTTGINTVGSGQTLTVSPANDLAAIEALSGTGFAARTGTETWALRTLQAGSGITISNPAGIGGDPVITASTSVPLSFVTDSGTAVPSSNSVNIIGTSAQGISTSGTGSSVTLTIANATALQKGVASFNLTEFTVTAGAVAANPITITAGTGLTGGGSVNLGGSVTLNLSVPVSVANGGTGDITLTSNGVLYGNGTSPVGITSAGTNGQVLIGSTGGAPAFATLLGTNGITFTTGANSLTINNTNIPNSALQNSSITLSNGANINITGSPVSLGGTATIAVSGTTNHAVQLGNGSGSLTSSNLGTNGQVLIGATGADPAFATLTSSDSSITFTTGANTLDLKAASPTNVLITLTPDEGGAVTASSNNINAFGIKDGATAQVTMTHKQGGNFTIEDRTHETPYVVDPSSTIGSRGTFTTIASAITAAVADGAPRNIFIKPGVYSENITLAAGINLTAFAGDSTTPCVTIVGKLTYTDTGTVTLSNIKIQTNSDFGLVVSGANACTVYLTNCYLYAVNNTFLNFSNSNAGSLIKIQHSTTNVPSTQTFFTMSSPGTFYMNYVTCDGSLSAIQSTVSAGVFWSNYTAQYNYPVATSATGGVNLNHSRWSGNVTQLTHNGTGQGIVYFCEFDAGGAAAVSIGAGASLTMAGSALRTTGGNCIVGSGTLQYSALDLIGLGDGIASTIIQSNRSTGPIIQLNAGPQILSGSGSPNGVVTAPKGSFWFRTDGSTTNNRAYINTNGSTGWTAITTVA